MSALALILLLVTSRSAFAAPVTLQGAFSSALERNELMAEQERLALQSEERYTQAKGNLLPNLSVNASYFVQDLPSDAAAAEFFPRTQPNVALTLKQPIFRGTREYAGIRQLGHLNSAQKLTRDQAWLDLHDETARVYYGLASAQKELQELRKERDLYKERINELKERVRAGTSSETDLLTSQAADAQVASRVDEAEGMATASAESFAYVTGLPRETDLSTIEPTTPEPRPLTEDLTQLEARPELRSAKERYEASDDAVQVAWGQHLPTIDFTGNYYLKRPTGFYDGINWDFSLSFSMPLYAGGIINSQVRDAALGRENANLEVSRLRRDAERRVRTLHATYVSQLGSMKALARSHDLAERNYALLRRDYRRGLTRNLDVLQALTSSQETKRNLIRARFIAEGTWAALLTASGRIIPK